jgi:hypothetical protein
MLNLLFISDSPKAEHIKSVLQPFLKVIIDVVPDFDHGLKDVFEKRPATVCIQEQIGGVTGESVARHIQMLLGNSAPTFILLFSGNVKPKAIKGLYEHIIDLKQSNRAVAEELKNILKSLLGDQWERICIPPKLTPDSVRATVTIPEESREDADKLVDDFLSDLETSGVSIGDEHPLKVSTGRKATKKSPVAPQAETPPISEHSSVTAEFDRAQAINDDLMELLRMEENKGRLDESPAAEPSTVVAEPESVVAGLPKPALTAVKSPSPVAATPPEPPKILSAKTPVAPSAGPPSGNEKKTTASAPVSLTPPPAAAEFRINQNTPLADEHIPEDLLLAFEENYYSESRFVRRAIVIAVVCAVSAAGGWYLVTQKPQVISLLRQRFLPSTGSKQAPPALPTPIPVQKPQPPPVPQPAATPLLPTFIPKEGHDSTYAAKNPGWERYIGKDAEFRLFGVSGRIQAVQVLSVQDAPIQESLLKTVLREFAGTPDYQITSRSTKAGIRVENGRIMNKGEVVIYRKNGAVKAFVVSVNE